MTGSTCSRDGLCPWAVLTVNRFPSVQWPKVEHEVGLLDHQDPAGAPFGTLEVTLAQVDPWLLGMRLHDLLERPEQRGLLRIAGERSESAVKDADQVLGAVTQRNPHGQLLPLEAAHRPHAFDPAQFIS